MRSFLALALLTLAVAAVPGAARARSLQFVFSGTACEPGGRPMRGVEIYLERSKAKTALADRQGRFLVRETMTLRPGGPPVRLVLRAHYRDWNMALPDGSPALGIEVRQVRSADAERIEVRSNDPQSARIVAGLLRAPGDVVIALTPGFVRQLGHEDLSPPALGALETVALDASGRPLPVAAAPDSSADSLRAAAPNDVRAIAVDADEPTRRDPGPEPGRAPLRPERLRLFPSAPEHLSNEPPWPPAPETAPVADTTRAPKPGAALPAPAERNARRAAPPAPSATAPAPPPRARLVATPDTTRAAAPRIAPPDPARAIRVSVRDDSVPRPARAGAGRALRVVHGVAVADTARPREAGCGCDVRGTVEVFSDRPLDTPLRVVVAVADAPMAADTVTLFMGSPRGFDLGRFPCGGHRLEVRPLGSRRFVVAAPPPSVFPCVAGMQPFRVILKPRGSAGPY